MRVLDEFIAGLQGFEWDEGNSGKSWLRHQVRQTEAEQAFLNQPLLLAVDLKHSRRESRFLALGRTDASRQLAIVFTVRSKSIRVISVRDMNRKERDSYAKHEEETSA